MVVSRARLTKIHLIGQEGIIFWGDPARKKYVKKTLEVNFYGVAIQTPFGNGSLPYHFEREERRC